MCRAAVPIIGIGPLRRSLLLGRPLLYLHRSQVPLHLVQKLRLHQQLSPELCLFVRRDTRSESTEFLRAGALLKGYSILKPPGCCLYLRRVCTGYHVSISKVTIWLLFSLS